jgi:putative ATP-dependent endonuclease of OLD family
MKIRRLSWSNYRRLHDAEVHIRQHAVLVGPNDSGKSSILRAIHLCIGATNAHVAASVTPDDFTTTTEPLLLEVTLDSFSDVDRAAFPDEIATSPDEQLTIRVEATVDSNDPEQMQLRRYFPDAGHHKAPSSLQLKQIGWAYVAPIRSLFRELGQGSSGALRQLLSSVDLSNDRDAFDNAQTAFDKAIKDASALEDLRTTFAEALSDALPRDVASDDLDFKSTSDLLDDPLASVTMTVADGKHTAPLTNQSDGIRSLALLAILGLSNNDAAITGIDEPEIHLHHSAQRSVAARLKRAPGQKIIVTHSPAIVSKMSPLDVIAIQRDRAPRQLQQNARIGEVESTARHWVQSLIEPVTAKAVILVEGPSDRIIVERVAELQDIDLNRLSIAIFELDGSGLFSRAYDLFGPAGFDIPLFGLLDEDAKADWADTLGVSVAELEADERFQICSADLEDEYVLALGADRTLEILLGSPSFNEKSIRNSCAVPTGKLTTVNLAEYCRHKKRKVQAALAMASGMTDAEAKAMASIVQLLEVVSRQR